MTAEPVDVEREVSRVGRVGSRAVAHGSAPSPRMAAAVLGAVVVIWGLGTPAAKLITAPPLVAASTRFCITAPLLWALVHATGGRMSWRVLAQTAPGGVLYGTNMVFIFLGVQHTSVAVVTVIQALQPGIVLLVAGRWLGERPTRWHVLWTLTGIAGVVVLVLGGDPAIRGDALGLFASVMAMVCFTGYSLLNRRARSTTSIDPVQLMAGVSLFACLTVTPVALLASSADDYRQIAGSDWFALVFVAVVVGILGHTMMGWAHRFVAASRSSLVLLGANVVSVIVAWPLFDEAVTFVQAVSGVVVLCAVAAVISRPAAVRVGSVTISG